MPILRRNAKRQFRSSGSTGNGETSTPSSIRERASSGEASPDEARALIDEGVEVSPLPVLPDDRN